MTARRRLLVGAGVAFVGSVAGCLGASGGSDSPGTADLPTRLWLERVDLSSSEREEIDPIVFADLPPEEQQIVETAIEDGEYTVDSEEASPALESLRDRIERRADGGLEVYLRRGETYYRVGFAEGDHIIAHPSQ
ncbi:hypothetical protein [Haloplanus aerogenes]|uniref:DUF7979 domain-containing protein n=1 Tax=Haloplanus aerogenes TaxID=660522 RepID=A0A3M0DA43_9EURY|nr:hypothetical protein [Haloplanus aerogenes]AZH26278.1 hypothetical protein DU502_13300 [Haloplanus aerogenes]RMB18264.1 hypothetical protein ATH50_1715 [Haloplanus aerogenes]